MTTRLLKDKLEDKLIASEEAEIITLRNNNNILNLSKIEPQQINAVPEFVITLDDAKQRLLMLQEFVKEIMIPGLDYGIIPKCDKPSLFKSGAEKLTDIFGFSKHVEVINRLEDWDKGIFHYEIKATLINKKSGLIEAEGIGSCNSKEKKYASSPPFNIINTILKMAKKRAFIDAVLSATRSSGLFSQDIEDLIDIDPIKPTVTTVQNNIPTNISSSISNHFIPSCKTQLNELQIIVNEKNIPVNKIKEFMKERYSVSESKKLSSQQCNDFINYLSEYKNP